MPQISTTPEFNLLASAAKFIKPEFEKNSSPWAASPFEWILALPSASKGKLGKRLVYQWCALKGLSIDSSPDSQADMMINGHREWKLSFLPFGKPIFISFNRFAIRITSMQSVWESRPSKPIAG